MQPKLAISFQQRGLPGLLCMALGLSLCIICRNFIPLPADLKKPIYWLCTLLAVGGGNLVGSYVWQRPWAAMKNELLASATMVASMLVIL